MKSAWRRLALCILMCVLCAGMPKITARADNIDAIRNQLNQAKEGKEAIEKAKEDTEEQIGGLSNAKNSLQGQLSGLTEELTEISRNLEEIEKEIIEKNAEIEETLEKLEIAKETEAEQYAAMKRRLRHLYEDNNRTYLDRKSVV